jgi:uncharacterized membrane protein YfcA
MPWYGYILLIAAGFIAGFVNTLAGSGSLVTLPALIFLGLPATVANGTNRVAILLQNIVAVASFHGHRVLEFRRGVGLAIPAILGSLLGARIAVGLSEAMMRRAIGALMLAMAVVILLRPRRWLEGRSELTGSLPRWVSPVSLFFVGVYGGFIQAGVGIFLLASLVLASGFDLVRANAVKVLIVLCFTVFALAVFVRFDQVEWVTGLVLGIGNMAGARVAAGMAVKRGTVFIRGFLLAVVVVSGIAFLVGF